MTNTATRSHAPHAASDGVNLEVGERTVSALAGGALVLYGARRRTPAGAAAALLGATLIARGASGRCPVRRELARRSAATTGVPRAVRVERALTIYRDADEVYAFWRRLENLPCVFRHLERVEQIDARRARWHARLPGGLTLAWESELVEDRPGESVAWRSLPGSDVDHHGFVRFRPAPGGRGTEVDASITIRPPGGVVGAAVARLFHGLGARQLREDLRRAKQLLETGELSTTQGQPSGRERERERRFSASAPASSGSGAATAPAPAPADVVEQASAESFPASDPPAYTPSGEPRASVPS